MSSGTTVIRGELALAGSVGDAILHSPENCVVVIGFRRYVGEGVVAVGNGGLTLGSPKEGSHLCAGTTVVRGELTLAGAGGNALFYSPEDRLVEVVLLPNVREGICCSGGFRAACGSP